MDGQLDLGHKLSERLIAGQRRPQLFTAEIADLIGQMRQSWVYRSLGRVRATPRPVPGSLTFLRSQQRRISEIGCGYD